MPHITDIYPSPCLFQVLMFSKHLIIVMKLCSVICVQITFYFYFLCRSLSVLSVSVLQTKHGKMCCLEQHDRYILIFWSRYLRIKIVWIKDERSCKLQNSKRQVIKTMHSTWKLYRIMSFDITSKTHLLTLHVLWSFLFCKKNGPVFHIIFVTKRNIVPTHSDYFKINQAQISVYFELNYYFSFNIEN